MEHRGSEDLMECQPLFVSRSLAHRVGGTRGSRRMKITWFFASGILFESLFSKNDAENRMSWSEMFPHLTILQIQLALPRHPRSPRPAP